MHLTCFAATACFGLPPLSFFLPVYPASLPPAAPIPLPSGPADLWLVIALLLLSICSGGGILCLVTAGLDRAERRLLLALEHHPEQFSSDLLPQGSDDRTPPSRKSPWP